MSKYKPKKSFDILGGFQWYTPGIGGIIVFLLIFLAGLVLAGIIGSVWLLAGGGMDAFTLITYVLMFIPVLIFAGVMSRERAVWEKGYALDNNHFAPYGGVWMAVMAALSMFCLGLALDPVNSWIISLAPMTPDWEQALEQMVGGNFLFNFLSVCIFAPLFEEWMCRGIILRSLLQKIRPVWAIVISALIFALIHGNIWQGFNAFAIGLLLGYVYYRTGSLKLTILMHFCNNFLSLMLSRMESLSAADSWSSIMPGWAYWTMVIAAAAITVGTVIVFSRVPLTGRSNCDEILPEEIA